MVFLNHTELRRTVNHTSDTCISSVEMSAYIYIYMPDHTASHHRQKYNEYLIGDSFISLLLLQYCLQLVFVYFVRDVVFATRPFMLALLVVRLYPWFIKISIRYAQDHVPTRSEKTRLFARKVWVF